MEQRALSRLKSVDPGQETADGSSAFRPARGRRAVRALATSAALLGAAATGWWWSSRPLTVTTVQATRGTAIDAAYATATVEAKDRVTVRAHVAGTVSELFAHEGDAVKKGQLLARLDAPDLQADLLRSSGELATSRAEIVALEAELESARAEADRARALAKTQSISTVEADRASSRVTVLAARVDAARAKADATASQIRSRAGASATARELEVRAPQGGVILRREVTIGDAVPARAPLFDVAEPKDLLVECVVDEADMGRVDFGTRAVVAFRAVPQSTFVGKVVEIGRDADRAKKSFIVKVQLDDVPPQVRTGMSAEVNLILAERPDAVLVAPGSVDQGAVWVVREGRAHREPVTVGARSPNAVEILRGVSPGDAVILDVERPREGRKVQVAPLDWKWSKAGG